MGTAPPADAPSPEAQDSATARASFSASPSGIELCGFELPFPFSFNLSFSLPSLDIDFPPSFDLQIGLSCDGEKPVSAPDGGGREGTKGLDDDDEFDTPD